ncbi:MAG: hypothetical protein IT158_16525 [Bryobacterales bacterium]|nr:hypothetical protein [Bryobacterales bacterium]
MPLNRRVFLKTAAAAPILAPLRLAAQPARLPRRDCFFGLHFDLHPNPGDPALGRDVSDEMVERLLTQVKPDFVQYDCKGHVGYLGYPSRVGTPAPHIVKDSLAIWRAATARHGVALFIHFSGLWDSLAIRQHPEWACVRPDGAPDPNATSTWGPYVDKLMIPQLLEVSGKYDLDGAWVDGECWAVRPDYGQAAAEAFTRATGIAPLPRGPGERGWQEFLEFNRAQFRRYVAHYIGELHRQRPKFQVASNWLYTTLVPERPEIPVDYLSGDYLGNASISTARLDARYLAGVGNPWDLMAWGFQSGSRGIGFSHKSSTQLQQEASVVLAQGGGFQIYYQPTRAGKIDDRYIAVMAKVARFCRLRQALSHKTAGVPQVGVLFSKHCLYTTANKLFGSWGSAVDPARGLIDALVECHYSVDVIPEWRLEEVAALYPVIAVPDWQDIGLHFKPALVRYVRNGGNLLLVGAENAALFSGELPVRFLGQPSPQPAFVPAEEVFGNLTGLWQDVEPRDAQAIEQRYPAFDSTRDGKCAATLSALGSGKIAAIYGPFGKVFTATHAAPARQFLDKVMRRLFTPLVEVAGPPSIEVALRKKSGRLALHLVNCSAMQVAAEYAISDFVPAVGPLEIRARLAGPPSRVTFEPGGRPVNGNWSNGEWRGVIDRLEIHGILAFEGVNL